MSKVKPKRRHPWYMFPKNISIRYKPWYKILWGAPFALGVWICKLIMFVLFLLWKFSWAEALRESGL